MSEFVHLHNHSDYSLQDGASRIDDLVNAALENNMKAVALTDHGNLFGALNFYLTAKSKGVKPIIGMEAYITIEGNRKSRPKSSLLNDKDDASRKSLYLKNYNHITLLVKNETGYKNLSYLSSKAYLEGFYYRPRIDFDLLKEYSEGIICLSGCAAGVLSYQLLNDNYEKAKEKAIQYKEIFGDDFYIEIQNHHLEVDKILLEGLPRLARELGIKLVATNDVHYIKREHAIAHNVLLQISQNRGQSDYKTLRYGTDEFYFRSKNEMVELFKEFPDAIANTIEIADKINFEMQLGKTFLPKFNLPEDENVKDLDDYITKLTFEGLQKKLGDINDEVRERADYELSIIKKMGYSGYFLIVQDFIKYAKNKGILVGPGRGSAAGSLVAYALDITNVNPIECGLLFERFLNPDRISLPDIDTDFLDSRRNEVIEYILNRYGEENCAQIVTFSTLSSRQILKDVGRVLGIQIQKVENITKFIPREFGRLYSIERAINEVPELRNLNQTSDQIERELIEYSKVLEDMNRNLSIHAAGIVIAPGPIIDYVPLCVSEDKTLTQYDKDGIEKIGLLKFDILGLKTLNVIQKTIDLIEKNHHIKLDINQIPLDDKKTYDLFSSGKTIGVFQFDKQHTREFLKRLRPTNILELSAMNALNRPGPMKFIDEFIARKHGQKQITYLHPLLKPVLEETYGIIVYQEQVMRIAHEVIGYTLSRADLMRRAMGKKDERSLAAERYAFIESGINQGIDRQIVEQIFEEIYKFKDYGFNKSHSVAYSIIAYQTAYLKAHYPIEFLAANLSVNIGKPDEITLFVNECRKFNIEVLPPDINKSFVDFAIEEGKIRFGLSAIKNVGERAAAEVVSERRNGDYKNVFDFFKRIDSVVINKKAIEALICSGAFDSLHPNRKQLYDSIDFLTSYSRKEREKAANGLVSFFDTNDQSLKLISNDVEDWSELEKLQKEHELLGSFITSNPLLEYEEVVRSFSNISFAEVSVNSEENFLSEIPNKIISCVILTKIEKKIYQDNKMMARLTVSDLTGETEFIIFDDAYQKYKNILTEYSLYMMIGKGELRGDTLQVRVDEIYPLNDVISKFGKGIILDINANEIDDGLIDKLELLFSKKSGSRPVYISLLYSNGGVEKFDLVHHKVQLSNELIKELRNIISKESIRIIP